MAQNSLTSTSSKEVVLSLKIDGGQALKTVVETQKELELLKNKQKGLNELYKQGAITADDYYKELARIKTEINDQKNVYKANQKILDEQVKAYKKNEGSINSMRANLKILRAQYEDLSKAERESAKGDALLKQIKDQTAAIKQLEAEQGDFTRNVGNYKSVWDDTVAGVSTLGDVLSKVFGAGFGNVVKSVGNTIGYLSDLHKKSGDVSAQMSSMNQTITDTAAATQNTSNVVENAGQSFSDLGTKVEDASKPIVGFGAAERAAVDEAKNMASATSDVASATSEVAESAAAAATSETAAATAVGGLSGAFKLAKTAVSAFSKQLLALLANPIVAIIAAIAAVVMKLVSAFKQNDQAVTALKQAFSAFQPILNVINNLFSKLVDVATKAVTALGNAAKAVIGFFAGDAYKKAQEQAEALIVAQDKLEDKEREYTLAHADNEAKIAELREIASDAENHTIEERKNALIEAEKIERADLDEKKAIAAEKVRLAEQEALQVRGWTEMTAEAWEKLTDEEKDNITQLRAALRETDKEMSEFERRMNKQMNALDNQQKAQAKEAAKTAKEAAKNRAKNEKEALRSLEDIYLNSIRDLRAKEEALLRSASERKIEDLKERLKTEANLSKKARAAINREIILLEAQLQEQLYDLSVKYDRERLQKDLDAKREWYQTLLKGVQTDTEAEDTIEIELIKIDEVAQLEAIKNIRDDFHRTMEIVQSDIEKMSGEEFKLKYGVEMDQKGLATAEDLINWYRDEDQKQEVIYQNSKTAIAYQAEIARTKVVKEGMNAREALAQSYADTMNEIETTQNLEKFYYNEVEKSRILQEQAQYRLNVAKENAEKLAQYSEQEQIAIYGNVQAYQNAVAEAQLEAVNAEVALADAMRDTNAAIQAQKDELINTFSTVASSINDTIASFQDIFDVLAESDEKYRKYSTALAMMQILVSTAISIANAIQGATAAGAATGVAAPFTTPAFIVEMVAIVSGAIASAVTTLKKAQASAPSKPKFSHGGLVGNQVTTRTDDTVDARLSIGEYIISAPRVKELGLSFLDALNGSKVKRKDLPLKFSSGGVVPSVQTISKVETTIDYSQMKEMFTEVVQEIQPVVSVQEINAVQTRVNVKEQTASYR